MKRNALMILLSLVLFLILIFIQIRESQPEWAKYQESYFTEQAKQREIELSNTTDENLKLSLTREVSEWKSKKPEIVTLTLPNGNQERCQSCHLGIEEISLSHPTDSFGCTVCHGGNGLALDEKTAHANWHGEGKPGNLTTVNYSCGGTGFDGVKCHSGNPDSKDNPVDLVQSSIMVTKAGELSTVRRAFNIFPWQTIEEITLGTTSATLPNPLKAHAKEELFKEGCLSNCHQAGGNLPSYENLPAYDNHPAYNASANESSTHSTIPTSSTAEGCQSCHVLTNPTHTYQGQDVTIDRTKTGYGQTHQITTQIPYTQCNQCHNQGKHDGVNMTFTSRKDLSEVIAAWEKGEETWEERFKNYYLPGEIFTQCEVSLDCIDCHTRQDVMGDGKIYTSQAEAVHIQCQDCHGTTLNPPLTRTVTSTEDSVLKGHFTNSYFPDLNVGDPFVITAKGEVLPFIRPLSEEWLLRSKVTGKEFTVPLAYGTDCEQDPNKQSADDCHKCHNQYIGDRIP
jgi:hypothetical protein